MERQKYISNEKDVALTNSNPDVCFAFPKASRPQIVMVEGRSGSSFLMLGGNIIGATLSRGRFGHTLPATLGREHGTFVP